MVVARADAMGEASTGAKDRHRETNKKRSRGEDRNKEREESEDEVVAERVRGAIGGPGVVGDGFDDAGVRAGPERLLSLLSSFSSLVSFAESTGDGCDDEKRSVTEETMVDDVEAAVVAVEVAEGAAGSADGAEGVDCLACRAVSRESSEAGGCFKVSCVIGGGSGSWVWRG